MDREGPGMDRRSEKVTGSRGVTRALTLGGGKLI